MVLMRMPDDLQQGPPVEQNGNIYGTGVMSSFLEGKFRGGERQKKDLLFFGSELDLPEQESPENRHYQGKTPDNNKTDDWAEL